MKKLIILLSLIVLSSCGSYQLSTMNHIPVRHTRVIVPTYPTFWYHGLTNSFWRWNYYQRYNTPTVIIVKPEKPRVQNRNVRRFNGRKTPIRRKTSTRVNTPRRINTNRKN